MKAYLQWNCGLKKILKEVSTILLFLILCFSLASQSTLVPVVCGQTGSPWLSGWLYRKSHVIHSAAGAGANYQVKVVANYGFGADSESSVYFDSLCRADFGDIRFTDNDGTTLLDYWMEEETDYDHAIFWVKIIDDLNNIDRTIYLYYGKSDATTLSNGFLTNVYQLREHRSHPYQTAEYLFSTQSYYETILQMRSSQSGVGYGYIFVVAPKEWLDGKYLRFNWGGHSSDYAREHTVNIYDGAYLRSSMTDFPDRGSKILKGDEWLQTIRASRGTFDLTTEDVLVNLAEGTQIFCTVFFEEKDFSYTDVGSVELNWIEVNTGSHGNGNINTEHFDKTVVMEQVDTQNDYGLYRKYANPEPAHGSWGVQEFAGGEAKTDSWWAKGVPLAVLAGIITIGVVLIIRAFKLRRKYRMAKREEETI